MVKLDRVMAINQKISKLKRFIEHYLVADMPRLSLGEGIKSALGTAIGVGLVLSVTYVLSEHHWMIAAVGATAIILFLMPQSPMAQPWSVFGGYLLSGGIALVVTSITTNSILGICISVALIVALMIVLKCIHPPAGAIAIFVAVQETDGMNANSEVMGGIILSAALILLVATIINKILGRQYPQCLPVQSINVHKTENEPPTIRTGITHHDLDYALKKHGTYVDAQETELIDLYETAIDHAFSRKMNTLCGDIMAKDVIWINEEDSLLKAWSLLHKHKIKALPVVNAEKRVIGIVTIADFLKAIAAKSHNPISSLEGLLSGNTRSDTNMNKVGEVMTKNVLTEKEVTPISTLVKKLSDLGIRHVPILNAEEELVGMISQSDLIASMYKKIVLGSK